MLNAPVQLRNDSHERSNGCVARLCVWNSGGNYVRVSLASSKEDLEEGVERLQVFNRRAETS